MALQDLIMPPDLPAGPVEQPQRPQVQPTPLPVAQTLNAPPQPTPIPNAPENAPTPAPIAPSRMGVSNADRLQQLGAQQQPLTPKEQRVKAISDFISGTLYSVGKGLQAGANAPAYQKTKAAVGAALQGGSEYKAQKEASALKEQQQQLAQQKADQAAAIATQRADQADQTLQASIKNQESMQALHAATIANMEATQTRLRGESEAKIKEAEAHASKLTADAAAADIKVIPNIGAYKISTGDVISSTRPNDDITITPELVNSGFKDPTTGQFFVGKTMKVKDLLAYMKPRTMLDTATDDVLLIDGETGKTIKNLGAKAQPAGGTAANKQLMQIDDPDNPGHSKVVSIDKSTLETKDVTQNNETIGKTGTQLASMATGLEKDALNATTQYGILEKLVTQKTRAADQDIVLRYFDIAAPVVGRRMNQTELDRLSSAGTMADRLQIMLHIVGSREIFDDGARKEIMDAAKANVDGKTKAWDDFQKQHPAKKTTASTTAPPPSTEDLVKRGDLVVYKGWYYTKPVAGKPGKPVMAIPQTGAVK